MVTFFFLTFYLNNILYNFNGDIMKNLFKYSFIIIVIILIFGVINSLFIKTKLTNSNEEFLKILLKNENYYEFYIKDYNSILNRTIRFITNIDIKKPTTLLDKTIKYKNKKTIPVMYVSSSDEFKDLDINSKYIEDPIKKKKEITDPVVYIYNTHQLESYEKREYEDYNITPNVMMASYILRENLNNKNIDTIVEVNNITDFLNTNGWDYSKSYDASRYYIKDALNKYSNLKLIIDIHRDSIDKNLSTITINNKKYAKVLFVIGIKNRNYNANLDVANKLDKIINKEYPGLSRGIMKKEGKYVNGIYNQDLNNNIILIEFGGTKNTIEEIMNTSIALSNVIEKYLEV